MNVYFSWQTSFQALWDSFADNGGTVLHTDHNDIYFCDTKKQEGEKNLHKEGLTFILFLSNVCLLKSLLNNVEEILTSV